MNEFVDLSIDEQTGDDLRLEAQLPSAENGQSFGNTNPSDVDQAKRVIEGLCADDEAIDVALGVMADGISRAHALGAGFWEVSLFTDVVPLNVGPVYVCALLRDSLFLALWTAPRIVE